MADEDIEVRARLIADTGDFLTPMAQAQAAISQFQRAVGPTNKMLLAAGAAAGAAGFALFKYGKAAFETAATVAELDVAIEAVGRSTGIGANKIREATEAIRSNGITMDAAQRIALTYARNNLDMAAASKVARVAQDLAVLSQKDSTQTAELLTRAIQTGSSILLKSAGISKYASEGYAAYARQLGKNANSLTAVERQQAMVNLVLTEGTKVAGVYEKSMTEPGKVLRSFKRLQSDMRLEFGKVLLEGFGPSIKALYDLTSAFSKSLREGGAFAQLLKRLGDSARIMGQPIADAIGKLMLFVKNIDEGVIPAERLQKVFDRLAPSFAAVSAGLSALTGAKLLSFFGPFKGIASKISPFVTAIVFLTALSPKLQESFAKMVAAAKPLVPAFIAIGAAIMDMAAVAADFFTVVIEVMAKLAPLITGVADAFSGLSNNLGILKPLLQFIAVTALANYIKSALLARNATGAYTNSIMLMGMAIKNAFGAMWQTIMRFWSNFQFGIKTGNSGMVAFRATTVASLRAIGVAVKGLLVSMAPMIAIFAAFKLYEMFTKSSKEAKERTKELSDSIKDQIYQLKGAATAIAGYANDLRGINDNLVMTGENADKIRLAMADLNIPLGNTVKTFQDLKKNGADAMRAIAETQGITGDALDMLVGYVEGANKLDKVPEQFREQAQALKTLNDEAKKTNIKDLVKTQIEQIRITSKLGEKAYKLAKEQAAADGVLKGVLDTEEEYVAVNDLLAKKLVELEAKEKAKAKSSKDAAKATMSQSQANWALITSLNTLKTKSDDGKVSVDAFAETMFGGYKDANQFTAAINGMRESAYGLTQSLKNTKGNTDEFNKAGMALFNQLTENGAKITELGGNTGDLVNYYKSMIAQFTKAAEAAGWNKTQIDNLLKSLGILQALDSITVKIDADIKGLKLQLYFANQQLEAFEKRSGVYNQQRAENYARLIASLNAQITTLEKSTKATKTDENTWSSWTDTSDAAKKAADALERQKEKLRRKIMEVAEKALAKARERMEEYKQAMDAMADAAKTAIYGSYSLSDALSTAERAAEEHNDAIKQAKDEMVDYGKSVAESIKETISFSDAMSGYMSVANDIKSANDKVAEAQAKVNEEQKLYDDLLKKADLTTGRKARREAYEEAAKQLEKVTEAQTQLTDATKTATAAQEAQKSVLDRLREQYKQAVKFSTELDGLVAKGLSKEGFDELLGLGAETGLQFIEELNKGGTEAVGEVNKMFKELSDLSKKQGDTVANKFFTIGAEIGADFMKALSEKANEASQFAEQVKRLITMGLSPTNIRMVLEAGVEAGSKIAAAIEKGGVDTITQMNEMEASLRGQAENLGTLLNNTFYKAGFDLATQIVQGIEDKIEDLNEKLKDMTIGQLRDYLKDVQAEFDAILAGLPIKPADTKGAAGTTGTTGTTGGGAAGGATLPVSPVFTPAEVKEAVGILEAYGFNATNTAKIIEQNIGNPFVAGGIPDYLRVIQEQTEKAFGGGGGGIGGSLYEATMMANGGIVKKPIFGIVGEAGPEAVVPLGKGNPFGGGQTVINLTVNAGMGTDGKSVGDAIVNELKRWSRKNGTIPVPTV